MAEFDDVLNRNTIDALELSQFAGRGVSSGTASDRSMVVLV